MLKMNTKIFLFFLAYFLLWPFFEVRAISSANFKVDNNSSNPLNINNNSANFRVDSSLEPIVGASLSTNFSIESGAFVPAGQTPSPAVVSNGGGASICSVPDLKINNFCSQLYFSQEILSGAKDSNTYTIFINDNSKNISFKDAYNWSTVLNLQKGENKFEIYSKNACGNESPKNNLNIILAKTGDINNDLQVDDYDLSLLANNWSSDWCYADFNKDLVVNDYDLSYLAANWGL